MLDDVLDRGHLEVQGLGDLAPHRDQPDTVDEMDSGVGPLLKRS